MILGERCTRACGFCLVDTRHPLAVDHEEPARVADAVATLGLEHAVITSVARDDLDDGGASAFAATIRAIRARTPRTRIEVLIPDCKGDAAALDAIFAARPDVLNHNLETVARLQRAARPSAGYARSLALLGRAKDAGLHTKSGLIVGMGEDGRRGPRRHRRPARRRRRHPHDRAVPPPLGAASPGRPVVDARRARRRRRVRRAARASRTWSRVRSSDRATTRSGPSTRPGPRAPAPSRRERPVMNHAARLARARERMTELGIDALCVSVGPDLPYLTGYEAMPLERLTMLVVPRDHDATLVVPRLEAPACRRAARRLLDRRRGTRPTTPSSGSSRTCTARRRRDRRPDVGPLRARAPGRDHRRPLRVRDRRHRSAAHREGRRGDRPAARRRSRRRRDRDRPARRVVRRSHGARRAPRDRRAPPRRRTRAGQLRHRRERSERGQPAPRPGPACHRAG